MADRDDLVVDVLLRATARGWIDLYVIRPTRPGDEVFHRTIAELLQESARLRGEGPAGATVVADLHSARAHMLRATLSGLGIPHRMRPPGGESGVEAPAVVLAEELTERVVALERRGGELRVSAADGFEVRTRAVVLALGVEYRRLEAPGVACAGRSRCLLRASMSEAQAHAGEEVYVVGGGNSAGQAALHLARYAGG